MFIESCKRETSIRVIRLFASKSIQYFLKKKLQYDDLYDVARYVVLNHFTIIHRFTLQRQLDQKSICYIDVETRSNSRELKKYQRFMSLKKLKIRVTMRFMIKT